MRGTNFRFGGVEELAGVAVRVRRVETAELRDERVIRAGLGTEGFRTRTGTLRESCGERLLRTVSRRGERTELAGEWTWLLSRNLSHRIGPHGGLCGKWHLLLTRELGACLSIRLAWDSAGCLLHVGAVRVLGAGASGAFPALTATLRHQAPAPSRAAAPNGPDCGRRNELRMSTRFV